MKSAFSEVVFDFGENSLSRKTHSLSHGNFLCLSKSFFSLTHFRAAKINPEPKINPKQDTSKIKIEKNV
jgi:hypothetical protein